MDRMPVLQKQMLETICVYALNRMRRTRPVSTVKVERAPSGRWTLRKVEPRFASQDVRKSYRLVRALQREYRLGQ